MLNIKQIEDYISLIRKDEAEFSKKDITSIDSSFKSNNSYVNKKANIFFILLSIIDFLVLKFRLLFKSYRNKHIVYTSYNFTTALNGVIEDRIVKPLFTENILFINQSKEIFISKVNNQKVYNVGGLAKLIVYFSKKGSIMMRYFFAYQKVNKWLLGGFDKKEIYLMYYYELNSLSIIFSDFRHKLKLIEVQHGSIINYPPYSKPSPVKMIDLFYVKNEATVDYLKNNLCRDFETEYKLIPYPTQQRVIKSGIHILYASTVEIGGIHPVFLKYLNGVPAQNQLNVYIRLHPREVDKKHIFEQQIKNLTPNIVFDDSKNWLEGNKISNLIIVSPWSSIIEEAANNGFKTIIIDEIGKKRFDYLLSNNCFFLNDLTNDSFST